MRKLADRILDSKGLLWFFFLIGLPIAAVSYWALGVAAATVPTEPASRWALVLVGLFWASMDVTAHLLESAFRLRKGLRDIDADRRKIVETEQSIDQGARRTSHPFKIGDT